MSIELLLLLTKWQNENAKILPFALQVLRSAHSARMELPQPSPFTQPPQVLNQYALLH